MCAGNYRHIRASSMNVKYLLIETCITGATVNKFGTSTMTKLYSLKKNHSKGL